MPTAVRNITVINPIVQNFTRNTPLLNRKKVAAYARVSTAEEEQLTSYEAQVDYYTRHIKTNPEWEDKPYPYKIGQPLHPKHSRYAYHCEEPQR